MGLVLMVLGFMWWWPLELIILAALIANGRIGYRRRLQFAGSGPTGDWDHVTRMDRMGKKRIAFRQGGRLARPRPRKLVGSTIKRQSCFRRLSR